MSEDLRGSSVESLHSSLVKVCVHKPDLAVQMLHKLPCTLRLAESVKRTVGKAYCRAGPTDPVARNSIIVTNGYGNTLFKHFRQFQPARHQAAHSQCGCKPVFGK